MRATAKQRAMIRNSLRLWDHTTNPEYNALSSIAATFASFFLFFRFPFLLSPVVKLRGWNVGIGSFSSTYSMLGFRYVCDDDNVRLERYVSGCAADLVSVGTLSALYFDKHASWP